MFLIWQSFLYKTSTKLEIYKNDWNESELTVGEVAKRSGVAVSTLLNQKV